MVNMRRAKQSNKLTWTMKRSQVSTRPLQGSSAPAKQALPLGQVAQMFGKTRRCHPGGNHLLNDTVRRSAGTPTTNGIAPDSILGRYSMEHLEEDSTLSRKARLKMRSHHRVPDGSLMRIPADSKSNSEQIVELD